MTISLHSLAAKHRRPSLKVLNSSPIQAIVFLSDVAAPDSIRPQALQLSGCVPCFCVFIMPQDCSIDLPTSRLKK
eukprot:1963164-Amphidinium_carterae.1